MARARAREHTTSDPLRGYDGRRSRVTHLSHIVSTTEGSMRTTLVVPGLASGGPMVTSEASFDDVLRVLKQCFTRAFVRAFARDVERRGDESDGCSYIITR